MKSKERLQAALRHETGDRIPVDFGGTAVTGIHCKVVEGLRNHFGLEKRPVKVSDPFQMLGNIDPDLAEALGVDCQGLYCKNNMFGIDNEKLHEQVTPWGQTVLISEGISLAPDKDGNVYIYPQGDTNVGASGVMPEQCYFFNAIEKQTEVNDDEITPEDNLEEYGLLTNEDLDYFENKLNYLNPDENGVIASFGGTALGDVAFIPGMALKHPKGIRNVTEWYMSTIIRQEYIHTFFEKQTEIALENYKRLWARLGSKVDAVFTCGTDFGSQQSQFCSADTYRELWLPHYKRMNDWIHENTTWKVMKHSCGAIMPLLPAFIESGFDIMNPVQINAADMDSKTLKAKFGKDLTFWGGGIDTQKVLPFASPAEVKSHVIEQCKIFGEDGGFVFNTVHNTQANVPLENFVAMLEGLREINP